MEKQDITEKIIGCAFTVHSRLGFGLLESLYGKAMEIELRRTGLPFSAQVPINAWYDGHNIGHFYADLLVDDVIVELKSVRRLKLIHEVQLVNYLKLTGKDIGLLLNFGTEHVDIRRRSRILIPEEDQTG